jgi:hypothetical protein
MFMRVCEKKRRGWCSSEEGAFLNRRESKRLQKKEVEVRIVHDGPQKSLLLKARFNLLRNSAFEPRYSSKRFQIQESNGNDFCGRRLEASTGKKPTRKSAHPFAPFSRLAVDIQTLRGVIEPSPI